MTVGIIILLFLVAFVASRMFRSTKMWWAFMSAITAGLLIGILSKELTSSSNDEPVALIQSISTGDNEEVAGMQSSVVAVTEGTTIAIQGLQVTDAPLRDTLSDALIDQYLLKGRDSPSINDSS